jgi:hypothetical protein
MAIDKEFLAPRFEGREDAEKQISAIIAEYERTNLPLVKNRDDILAEKKAGDKKTAELQEKYAALEAAYKELNEKLESGLPDKERQIFQAEIEKLKTAIGRMTDDSGKTKAEYEAKIGKLSAEKNDYILSEEINKLIAANPAIFEAAKESGGLAKRFFADHPRTEFEPYDYGGKKEYVNKAGKKMADLLNDFLNTNEGKLFLRNMNDGGGAPGSSTTKPPTKNPFVKGQENLDEQARLLKENRGLYESLKAQAAAGG